MKATEQILPPLRSIPGAVFSFEALVVLYLFAGIYKGDPRLAAVPVDLTALFFGMSVLVGGLILLRNPIHRKSLPVVFATVCLVVWLMVSLAWSPSRVYGPAKVFSLGTLVLWAVIAGAVIIAPDPERVRRLFTVLLLFSLWLGVESLIIFIQAGGNAGRIRVLGGGGYLSLGRIAGLGALIALTAWLYGRGRPRWLYLTIFSFLGFVLAIAGGRGPVLAVALPLLTVAALGVRFTRTRILYWPAQLSVLLLLLGVASGLVTYSAVTDHTLASLDRLERLADGDIGGTGETRADTYRKSMEFAGTAPLVGLGVGAWPVVNSNVDVQRYPHNLFAELMVEGGLIAVALFLVLIATALRSATIDRMRHDPQALCAVMLFINTFLNAMVSSDVPGNRAMFLMIGLLALCAVRAPAAATTSSAPTVPSSPVEPLDWSRPRRDRVSSTRGARAASTDA